MRTPAAWATALVLLVALPLPAQVPPEEIWVVLSSPPPGLPAVGEVTLEAEVSAPAWATVQFLLDGQEVGRLTRPPYRLVVPLGESLGPHRFEVVVLGPQGELARAVRETPRLHVDDEVELELLQLYVTVTRGGEPQEDLAASQFSILDNGSSQRIVTFEGGDAALTAAILIDASASMEGGRLEAALEGARFFMQGMRDLDEAAVFLFSDAIRYRSPFSQRTGELESSIRQVQAGGGTALNDALYMAIQQLEARQGRRVVILLSDGMDIHSVLRMNDVLWAMQRSRSLVYWIELRSDVSVDSVVSPWKDAEEHRRELEDLRRLVVESGARVVPIDGVEQAATAFADILRELRLQYVLGYYPSVNLDDARWHQVKVKVRQPGVKVRVRGSYLDF